MKRNSAACAWLFIAAASLSSATATAQVVYDDFTTKWRPIDRGSGTAVETVRNRLEISLEPDASGDGVDFFVRGVLSACEISGDFDLRASFQLLDWPAQNGGRVSLYLGGLQDVRNRGVYMERDSYSEAEVDPGLPSEVYVFYADRGQTFLEHETADTQGRLRVQRVGSIVTGYYLSNSQWVELGSTDLGTEDLQFGVFALSHDSVFADSFVRVAFDTVRLAAGTVTGAACSSPL
jgi:hypothetical protein